MARKLWERLGNDGVQSLPESSSELIDNFSIKWEICGRTCDSSRKISIANECSQNWRTHFQMRNEHLGWIWKPSLISDWILMTLDSSTTWSQISNIRGCTKYNLICVLTHFHLTFGHYLSNIWFDSPIGNWTVVSSSIIEDKHFKVSGSMIKRLRSSLKLLWGMRCWSGYYLRDRPL